jgi:hypothetical protein
MCLSLIPAISFGQSEEETLRAFRKLQAKIQIGCAFRDYRTSLADALFEFNSYINSPNTKKNKEFAFPIILALHHFKLAAQMWETKIELGDINFITDTGMFSNVYASTVKLYPETARNINDGGASIEDGKLKIDAILSIIWKSAFKEIDNAEKSKSVQKEYINKRNKFK